MMNLRAWAITGGAAACLLSAGLVLGPASAADDGADASAGSDVSEMARSLTDEERRALLDSLPDDQRSGTATLLDQMAGGRIPVAGLVDGREVSGWVTTEMLSAPYPSSVDDLFPVTDDGGALIGFLAPGVSMISVDEVASGAPDAEILSDHWIVSAPRP